MADVFVSYSRQDEAFVRRLVEGLTAAGKEAWVDWEDIPPTAAWFDEIAHGIDGADAVVFVITPDSVASEVCRRELEHCRERGKRIIPLLARPVADADVPEYARVHNWIDFDDFDAGLATLIEALDTDLGHVREHTRLLQLALAWQGAAEDRSRLLRGSELAAAEGWLAAAPGHQPEATPHHTAFLLASRRGATRRQRQLGVAILGVLAISIGLTIFALIQRSHAIAQEHTAFAGELDARATSLRDTDPELGLLLATRAAQVERSAATTSALRSALRASNERVRMTGRIAVDGALYGPGGLIATTTHDGRTAIRRATTGRIVHVVDGQTRSGQVAFRPLGGALATGGGDGVVRIWDTASGRLLHELAVGEPTTALAWSARDRIATGSATKADGPGTLGIWAAASGRRLRRIVVHAPIGDLTWTPDGRTLGVSAGDGATLRDAGGRLRHVLAQPVAVRYPTVVFSGNGRRVVTAGVQSGVVDLSSAGVRVWSVASGRRIGSIPFSQTTNVAVNDAGSWVALVPASGVGQIYAIDQHRIVTDLGGISGTVSHVVFDRGAYRVAIATRDGTVQIFDTIDAHLAATLAGHHEALTAVRFSPDGLRVLTASRDGTTRIWALDRPDPGRTLATAVSRDRVQPGLARDGRTAALTLQDGSTALVDPRDARRLATVRGAPMVAGAAVSPDGQTVLVVGGPRGEETRLTDVRLWDRSGRLLGHPAVTAGLTAANLSTDGSLAIGADGDGIVHLWAARSGRVVGDLRTGAKLVYVVAGDAHVIVTSGPGRTALLWDAHSGRRRAVLRGHGAPVDIQFNDDGVSAAAISDDSTTVATGGVDGRAILYDARSGRRLRATAPAHTSRLTGVAFSHDGTLLATGGADGSVQLWQTATGARVAKLTAVAGIDAGTIFTTVQPVFSQDDGVLTAVTNVGVRMWDVASRDLLLDESAWTAAPTGDGRAVLVVDRGRAALHRCELCAPPAGLVALAKRRATRALTSEERASLLHGD